MKRTMMKAASLNGAQWWKNSILYSAYVDKFAGSFRHMLKKIEYLSRLGVDCIHLLPFYPSPMADDGYDVSDYCSIRRNLGTLEDFSRFIKSAHTKEIRVIIDFVLNHTSTEHPWFLEAKNSLDNPKRDFFLWSKDGHEYAGAANPFSALKSSNWIYNPPTRDYYFSTFYPEQADLNWNNPRVFSKMMEVVDFWAKLGVDGFRLDSVSRIIKKEGTECMGLPETHRLIKKIRAYVDKRCPGVVLLGEASKKNSLATLKTYFGAGDECHLIYNFPLIGKLFLALKRNDADIIQETAEESKGIPSNAQWATFLGHHDEIPIATLPKSERQELLDYLDPEKKYRFNSGVSLRLATIFRGNKQRILDAFRLLLKVQGSPVIYYGDEIGMENETLSTSEKDTRRSVRGKFDWGRADTQIADPESLLNGIANMIETRKRQPIRDSNRDRG